MKNDLLAHLDDGPIGQIEPGIEIVRFRDDWGAGDGFERDRLLLRDGPELVLDHFERYGIDLRVRRIHDVPHFNSMDRFRKVSTVANWDGPTATVVPGYSMTAGPATLDPTFSSVPS